MTFMKSGSERETRWFRSSLEMKCAREGKDFPFSFGVEIEISGLEIIRGCAQSSGEVLGNNRRFL